MIDIVRWRYAFYLLSLLIIIPGTIYLLLFGLRLGIDFEGGTFWQIQFEKPVRIEDVRSALAQAGYNEAFVQSFGQQSNTAQGTVTRGVSMRLPEIKENSPEKAKLEQILKSRFGNYEELVFTSVGPAVGREIRNRSIVAIALASLGILGYIAFAFRKVSHPFRYGICAIIAMLHDVLVVVGIFAILGKHFGVEIDALFVTALLTVIGFSVHDTIVVFDRIRENQLRRYGESFEQIVNISVLQTLVRSVNTSMTVIFTLLALYFFGGTTIKHFVLALLIGIVSGTYSSIFNASLLLVSWENKDFLRIFRRAETEAAAT